MTDAGGPSIDDVVGSFTFCVAPYLFGLLSFLVAVRGRGGRDGSRREPGISIAVLFGAVAITLAVMIVGSLTIGRGWETGPPVFIAIVFVSLVYEIGALRLGLAGLLNLRWYAALCCVAWFTLFGTGGDPLYGVWLALAGSTLIAVAAVGEATVRSYSSLITTLGDLLTCRRRLMDMDGPRCPFCGYLLIGLTSSRCPECGQGFNPEDHGLGPVPIDAR